MTCPLCGSFSLAVPSRTRLCRREAPRLPRVRAALLRIRPWAVHGLRRGLCRGLFLQRPRRLPILQRSPHSPDRRASRRLCHPARARLAVGDLGAEAIARHACRPPRAALLDRRSQFRARVPTIFQPNGGGRAIDRTIPQKVDTNTVEAYTIKITGSRAEQLPNVIVAFLSRPCARHIS